MAYNKGKTVPRGRADRRRGPAHRRPGRDVPARRPARRGALVPFAEHKGYALAMVCELLGAALTGGETMRPANLDDEVRGLEQHAGDGVRPGAAGHRQLFGARSTPSSTG